MSEKSKFGAVLILGIIFAIGAFSGVGGTVYYLKQSHGKRSDRGSSSQRSPRDIYRVQVDRMTERLEKSLNLTDEQVPLIRAEITKFGNAMMEVHESMRPQFHALMEERTVAIEQHLSEEQLTAFRADKKKHRERVKSHRDRESQKTEKREGASSTGPGACKQKRSCGATC